MSEDANIYTYKRRTGRVKRKNENNFETKISNLSLLWRQELGQFLEIKMILLAMIGFFLGRGVILGELIPFGTAFLAAFSSIRKRGSFLITLAVILGLATVTKGLTFGASALTVAITFIFLLFLNLEKKQKWFAIPLLVFSLTVIVKTTFVALLDPSFYNYVVVLFEASVAALLSVVFLVAIRPMDGGKLEFFKTNEEIICGFVLVASVIVGLGDIQIGVFSVKNIVSRLIILVACLLGGASMGAVAGTMVGLIPSIGALVAPPVIGLYAFAGMIAGLFKRFGKLGIGLGFMLGNILLSIYFTNTENLMASLGETLIGVSLFLLMPVKVLKNLQEGFKGLFDQYEAEEGLQTSGTTEKIRQLSRIFSELSKTFQQVSCETEIKDDQGIKVFIEGVRSKLCKKCQKEKYCWEQYQAYKGFLDAYGLLELEGQIKTKDLYDDLHKKCNRVPELVMALNTTYETCKVHDYWQYKVTESRGVVSEQLKGVSIIMDNLAEELGHEEVHAPSQKPLFNITYGVAKVGKGGSVISGDNYTTADLNDNKWAVMLSDGMGVGPKAAMESKAAITLLKQLLTSGINKDVAIKTVNSVLLLRSTEESFATMDLAVVDLNSAETDFLKVGAVPSFIKRENKVGVIRGSSLPIGILSQVHVENFQRTLQSGDILVMITDGVLDSRQDETDREDWLIDFLENLLIDDPQDIADLILWHAKNNSGGRILDDMTVIVLKLGVTDAF